MANLRDANSIDFGGVQANRATLNGQVVWQRTAVRAFVVGDTGAQFDVVQSGLVRWVPPTTGELVGVPTFTNGQQLGTVVVDTVRTQTFQVRVPNNPQMFSNANQVVTFTLQFTQAATFTPFSFEDGYVEGSFAVDINGMPSAQFRNGATLNNFNPASFDQSTDDALRNATITINVPAGFSNTGTVSGLRSATQPGTNIQATAGELVNFSPSVVDIPAAGASGTHGIDVTPDDGQWVVSSTGGITIDRNGSGDRDRVSWSIGAATTPRSGTITLSSGNGTLDTVNWNQLADPDTLGDVTLTGPNRVNDGTTHRYEATVASQTGATPIDWGWQFGANTTVVSGGGANDDFVEVRFDIPNPAGIINFGAVQVVPTKGTATPPNISAFILVTIDE